MDKFYTTFYKSAIGLIEITGTKEGILSVKFVEDDPANEKTMQCLRDEVPRCPGDEALHRQEDEVLESLKSEATNYLVGEIPQCLKDCVRQLDEYFIGKRKEFELELLPQGTPFQMKVWQKLMEIPYGKTASYKDIAEAVDSPKAVRAVGGANNKNKICIIIPCHRVIGSDGSLVGYGGGIWRKEWLLKHEKGFLF